jgi:hypothetical protein
VEDSRLSTSGGTKPDGIDGFERLYHPRIQEAIRMSKMIKKQWPR